MKGREAEKVAEKLLKKQGYFTHRAIASTVRRGDKVFTLSNDIFHCIDVVAVHPNIGVRFIQVTTGSGVSKRKAKIKVLPWYADKYVRVEIWETRSQRNVKDRRQVDWFFRQHQYNPATEDWEVTGMEAIPRDA